MASESVEPVDAPDWVLRRLNELATYDPLQFVRARIPALQHRTVNEVLQAPGGEDEVRRFLDRLEAEIGRKRQPTDFAIVPGFDPNATRSHPDFERLNVAWVRHRDGWSVGFIPPRVAYRVDERMAWVEANFEEAPTVTLDMATLTWIAPRRSEVESRDADEVLSRLRHGVRALGGLPVELPSSPRDSTF